MEGIYFEPFVLHTFFLVGQGRQIRSKWQARLGGRDVGILEIEH
jgi:hypothetical protein